MDAAHKRSPAEQIEHIKTVMVVSCVAVSTLGLLLGLVALAMK